MPQKIENGHFELKIDDIPKLLHYFERYQYNHVFIIITHNEIYDYTFENFATFLKLLSINTRSLTISTSGPIIYFFGNNNIVQLNSKINRLSIDCKRIKIPLDCCIRICNHNLNHFEIGINDTCREIKANEIAFENKELESLTISTNYYYFHDIFGSICPCIKKLHIKPHEEHNRTNMYCLIHLIHFPELEQLIIDVPISYINWAKFDENQCNLLIRILNQAEIIADDVNQNVINWMIANE